MSPCDREIEIMTHKVERCCIQFRSGVYSSNVHPVVCSPCYVHSRTIAMLRPGSVPAGHHPPLPCRQSASSTSHRGRSSPCSPCNKSNTAGLILYGGLKLGCVRVPRNKASQLPELSLDCCHPESTARIACYMCRQGVEQQPQAARVPPSCRRTATASAPWLQQCDAQASAVMNCETSGVH